MFSGEFFLSARLSFYGVDLTTVSVYKNSLEISKLVYTQEPVDSTKEHKQLPCSGSHMKHKPKLDNRAAPKFQ